MKSKTFFILLLLAGVLYSVRGFSAVIYLKDGRVIETDRSWEEGGVLKYQKHGATIGMPMENVDRIEDNKQLRDSKVVDFGFDVWKMGTKIEEVMDTAERNDIPLVRSGIITIATHFNAKACRSYMYTHNEYEYRQTVLNYPAIIRLTFTPESRRLGQIVISFNINPSDLTQKPDDDVVHMLLQSYDKPKALVRFIMIKNNLEWNIQGGNQIHLISYSNSTTLTYKNNYWYAQLEKEKQHQRDLKREAAFLNDSEKF